MMKLLFALAIASAQAGDLSCALDGSASATDAINAGVFAWAAADRCGKAGNTINCVVDMLSALQGVHNMINTILEAADSCGALHTENPQCGLAVSEFTASVEGFGAAVTATVSDCTGHKPGLPDAGTTTVLGDCASDLSGATTGLFSAATSFKKVGGGACEDGGNSCAGNALHVMDALAGLGGAIAGSIKDCRTVATGDEPPNVGCTADILGAFGSLSGIASAATKLASDCPASPERLYEVEQSMTTEGHFSSSQMMAAIPIAAMASLVFGFVGGSRYVKRTRTTCVTPQVCDDYETEARDVLIEQTEEAQI